MSPKFQKRSALKLVGRIIPYKQGQYARGLGKYLNRMKYLTRCRILVNGNLKSENFKV